MPIVNLAAEFSDKILNAGTTLLQMTSFSRFSQLATGTIAGAIACARRSGRNTSNPLFGGAAALQLRHEPERGLNWPSGLVADE